MHRRRHRKTRFGNTQRSKERNKVDRKKDGIASSLHMASNRVFAWGNLATTWVESLRDFVCAFFPQMRRESYNWCVIDRTEEKRQKKREAKRHTIAKKIFRYTPTKSARYFFFFSFPFSDLHPKPF